MLLLTCRWDEASLRMIYILHVCEVPQDLRLRDINSGLVFFFFSFFLWFALNGGVLIGPLPLSPLCLKWGRMVQSDVPWPQRWPPISLEVVAGNRIRAVSSICHQLPPCSHMEGQSMWPLNFWTCATVVMGTSRCLERWPWDTSLLGSLVTTFITLKTGNQTDRDDDMR